VCCDASSLRTETSFDSGRNQFKLPMQNVKIHPTAVVDPAALIGREVEIGPYAVIGAQVSIGDNTIVQSHAVIEGTVTVGSGNFIGHGAVIGALPQDLSFSPERKTKVEIGDNNVIREYCTIHRGSAEGTRTEIRSQNFLMAGAHIGHNCVIGSQVIIANNCLLGGHVTVEDGAFLGGGCLFHQFMRVGRLAIAQGGSAFGKDIPPFVIAAERNYVFGVNVIGLRRSGFSRRDRDEIKAAFKLLYTSGLNTSQALAESNKVNFGPAARQFFDFIAASKQRGVCRYKRGSEETFA
jgi:UDP-N-acetylglucosamine acyltransferase